MSKNAGTTVLRFETLKAQLGYILVGVVLNTAFGTLDNPHVLVHNQLDCYPDISPILEGISWRFPSRLIINSSLKFIVKFTKYTCKTFSSTPSGTSPDNLLFIYLKHCFYLFFIS